MLLLGIFVLPSSDSVRDWLYQHGIESPDAWTYEPRVSARLNGLLVELALGVGEASFRQPEKYSRSEVDRIIHDHSLFAVPDALPKSAPPINLIIYMVESLMDPTDLGVHFTGDPIPTLHALSRQGSHGRIVVPIFGGGSANTEFEVLTGLTMYFLPDASSAYRQYISQDIPSLPRFLRQHGYHTTAVLADPPYLFNRSSVYPHLGFESWQFPGMDPKTPRSPDPEWIADGAVADAVIAASQKASPYFIYAFTSGTHYPWDYPNYLTSSLEPTERIPEPHWSYLKTYANALRIADASLNKLISYYGKSEQRTAILVMGDHLPAFPGPGGIYEITGFFNKDELEQTRRRYQVPVALWCNWPVKNEKLLFSANYLAAWLLNFMGMQSDATMAFSADVRLMFPVLSRYVQTADGRFFPPHDQGMPSQLLLDDYRLMQYDLLLGDQYALGYPGWKLSAAP